MTDALSAFAGDDPPEIQTRTHDRYHAVIKMCASLPPVARQMVIPANEERIMAMQTLAITG